jgi:small subunit ribosomal protein S1
VELGENVHGVCVIAAQETKQEQRSGPVDVSTLSSMLTSKWKGSGSGPAGGAESAPRTEPLKVGQIRTFRITKLDAEKKRIDLELVS